MSDQRDHIVPAGQLKQGSIGWVGLASLGVATVIAGDFAAWNYGLGMGGWGGMMIALVIIACMYFFLVFSLAELAAMLPGAGGGYGYARRAFGPLAGFMAGLAVVLSYIAASAGLTIFIDAYAKAFFGVSGWPLMAALWIVLTSIHAFGIGEAIGVLLSLAMIAALGLIAFMGGMVPEFSIPHLFDLPVSRAFGASIFLPQGLIGIWAALPFCVAMFMGVESVVLAAEEARDPHKNVPRGMKLACLILFLIAFSILTAASGGAGSSKLYNVDDPLATALTLTFGEHSTLGQAVSLAALIGLIASLFSVMYAYSRQTFALSRAGLLPRFLAITNRRQSPYLAVIIPGLASFLIALTKAADQLIVIAVFGAVISYVIMLAAHIQLRLNEPTVQRPYLTPGGIFTSGVALSLTMLVLISCFLGSDVRWVGVTLFLLVIGVLYFQFYARHNIVSSEYDYSGPER